MSSNVFLKRRQYSQGQKGRRETHVAAITTSSVVTGWVWDLSCRRRSLCSTAAFLENRFGTCFSSNDFSISWDQKYCGILMNSRKGNWGSKMFLLCSPTLRNTLRGMNHYRKWTLVLCRLVLTLAKDLKRGEPLRAQVQDTMDASFRRVTVATQTLSTSYPEKQPLGSNTQFGSFIYLFFIYKKP